eukprot:2469423-Ditylum_brightwellii.AAC.1
MRTNLQEEECYDSLSTLREKGKARFLPPLGCLVPSWLGNIFPVSQVLQEWSMSIQSDQL